MIVEYIQNILFHQYSQNTPAGGPTHIISLDVIFSSIAERKVIQPTLLFVKTYLKHFLTTHPGHS